MDVLDQAGTCHDDGHSFMTRRVNRAKPTIGGHPVRFSADESGPDSIPILEGDKNREERGQISDIEEGSWG